MPDDIENKLTEIVNSFNRWWAENKEVEETIEALTATLNLLAADSLLKANMLELVARLSMLSYGQGGLVVSEMVEADLKQGAK